ncbi:flagellar hook-associated protein FlgL [Amphritea sp. HPY]|uniref:flagellar hook-associated protein FlgL n=1 Tax=Amphritea sp. HPY TaxID=3421652 RepID=UPI003D7CDC71
MRISTAQVFAKSAESLNSTSNSLFKIQQQLSTGKKILQPSDDPLASAQILKLTQEVEKTEQYQSNIDISRRRISLEETTLNAINTATLRVKELAIQANSGAVSDTDRTLIANELKEVEKELLGLMNTKDVQGEYLFSGYKGFEAAYSYDGASDSYVYNGDEGRRSIQVGSDNKVVSTDTGFEIFEKVPGVLTLTATAGTEFSERIITDHTAFQKFTDDLGPATINFDTGAGTYSVTDKNGDPVFSGNPAAELTGIAYQPGDAIEFEGVRLVIDNPADGALVLGTEEQRENVLNMVHNLAASLLSTNTAGAEGNNKLDEAVDRALLLMEGIQNKNIEARGSIGGRINALDHQQDVNEDFLLFTKEARSAFEDLDYNEAISEFALQQTSLNAAYSSFAKIQELSLFNFIR